MRRPQGEGQPRAVEVRPLRSIRFEVDYDHDESASNVSRWAEIGQAKMGTVAIDIGVSSCESASVSA